LPRVEGIKEEMSMEELFFVIIGIFVAGFLAGRQTYKKRDDGKWVGEDDHFNYFAIEPGDDAP